MTYPPLIPNTQRGFDVQIGEFIADATASGVAISRVTKKAISLACNPDLTYRNLYMYWFMFAFADPLVVDFPVRAYRRETLITEIPNRLVGGTAAAVATQPGAAYYFTAAAGTTALPNNNGFVFVRTKSTTNEIPAPPAYITATPLILVGEIDRIDVDIDSARGAQDIHILFAVASSVI